MRLANSFKSTGRNPSARSVLRFVAAWKASPTPRQKSSKKLLHTASALVVSSPLSVQAKGQHDCGPITVPLRGRD